ncbi:hypothetical protein FRC12_024552 [Ceratobasidium sp. 428]|nr:hypothetical protein FRC12_024552 [Ceratobasidium sp. 428]
MPKVERYTKPLCFGTSLFLQQATEYTDWKRFKSADVAELTFYEYNRQNAVTPSMTNLAAKLCAIHPTTTMQLVLKQASPAQEIIACKWKAVEWAKWLSLDDYMHKADRLATLDHANDGKFITWVLVPSDDPDTLDMLSTCTTFRREVLVLPPNETESFTSTGYVIAAVFTPPQLRCKGYARHMMSLLHFAIAQLGGVPSFPISWGQPPQRIKTPGIVSVLYSSVGALYSQCAPGEGTGWTVTEAKTARWSVGELGSPPVDPRVEFLSQGEAAVTVVKDIPTFKRDFESNGPSPHAQFAFLPTAAWCIFRMQNHMDHPDCVKSPPKSWGVRMHDMVGDTHFIIWTYKPYPQLSRQLIVINSRTSPTTFTALFRAMLSAAQAEGYDEIEAWGLHGELDSVVQNTGGRILEREYQLPAMRWYGAEHEIVWLGNDKLNWF